MSLKKCNYKPSGVSRRSKWNGRAVRPERPRRFTGICKKTAFPNVTYEDFLIDIINLSHFFKSKIPIWDRYTLTKDQSHGECDACSTTYQLDFKLLIDEDIMRARVQNMPEIDYSRMSEGFVFTRTKEQISEVPHNNLLRDIKESTVEDLRYERYKNRTITRLVNNLKKPKNIFLYYPYEYEGINPSMMRDLEPSGTGIFENILSYRDELALKKDTFVCFKINQYFMILEWTKRSLVLRDAVDEMLCSNYMDLKTYSVY